MNKLQFLASMKQYATSQVAVSGSTNEMVIKNDAGEFYGGSFSTITMTGGNDLWSKDVADAKRWGGESRDEFDTPEAYKQYLKDERDDATAVAKRVGGKVVVL